MKKNIKELSNHDKDTGSSEVQIGLLTEKIENLSKHIKQFQIFNVIVTSSNIIINFTI